MSIKLVIDAGHGGTEFGDGSNDKFLEKDMNLKISLYQYYRFKEINIPVLLTREKDEYVSLNERSYWVNNFNADYCLSNHINNWYDSSVNGADVIHSVTKSNEFASAIMDGLINAGMKKHAIWTRTLDNSNKDYYHMHRETIATTLIIEYGFASNKNDTNKIINNWMDYAESVIKSFCEYTNIKYIKPQYSQRDYNSMIHNNRYEVVVSFSTQTTANEFLKETEKNGYNAYIIERLM